MEDHRNNHFNLLRILLSAGVLLSHCFVLTLGRRQYAGEPWFEFTRGEQTLGITCVLGFFVLSGYLVSKSFERSALWIYARARLLRIYPAAIVCALVSALVLGPLVTSLSASDYFQSKELARFIWHSSTFLTLNTGARSLPEVFVGNAVENNMNGALWTLSWELICYALLVPFGLLLYRGTAGARRIAYVLLFVMVAAGCFEYGMRILRPKVGGFLILWGFFGIGILLRALLPRIGYHPGFGLGALACLLLMAGAEKDAQFLAIVFPVVLGIALINAAYSLPRPLLGYNRLGDFSYGLYLYGWPVQQTVVYVFPGIGPWDLFTVALPVALTLAVLSWRLVERPALALKKTGWLKSSYANAMK